MGEIADSMIDGEMCSICGCYFQDKDGSIYEHGYPAVCWSCWDELTSAEKEMYQRAEVKTI